MNKASKYTKKPAYSLLEYFEKPVSKKGFLKAQKKAVIGDSVSQAKLIKNKVFTKREITKLIKSKQLTPIKYRSRIYFDKKDLQRYLFAISSKKPIIALYEKGRGGTTEA